MSCSCGRQGFGARRGTVYGVKEAAWVQSAATWHCVRCEGSCLSKSLPETCSADHWRSIKLLLLHLVGFYFIFTSLDATRM